MNKAVLSINVIGAALGSGIVGGAGSFRMTTFPRYIGIIVALASSLAYATDHPPIEVKSTTPSQNVSSGARDFDFENGEWLVHHRVLRQGHWIEFEGTCRTRILVDGTADVEEHTFRRPEGTTYGIAIRAFDPKAPNGLSGGSTPVSHTFRWTRR